jgi:hypothetical protein
MGYNFLFGIGVPDGSNRPFCAAAKGDHFGDVTEMILDVVFTVETRKLGLLDFFAHGEKSPITSAIFLSMLTSTIFNRVIAKCDCQTGSAFLSDLDKLRLQVVANWLNPAIWPALRPVLFAGPAWQ